MAHRPAWSDQPGFGKRLLSTIFGDRLEGSGCGFHNHELLEFRDPDAFGFEIGLVPAGCDRRDVHADAALFLGQSAPVNLRSARGRGSCNFAFP